MDLLGQIMVIALFVGIIILCYLPFHKVYKKYKSVKILNGRSKKEENNLYFREVQNINNKSKHLIIQEKVKNSKDLIDP